VAIGMNLDPDPPEDTPVPAPEGSGAEIGCSVIVLVIAAIAIVYHLREVPAVLQKLPLAQYAKERPQGDWLELTNAHVDLRDAVILRRVKKGREETGIDVLYVPLRAPGETLDVPAHVVLETQDSYSIKLFRQLLTVQDDPERLKAFLTDNARGLVFDCVAKGMCTTISTERRDKLQSAAKLSPGFVVLEDGVGPTQASNRFWFLVGAPTVFFLFCIWLERAKRAVRSRLASRGARSRPASAKADRPARPRDAGSARPRKPRDR